jgi:hypothetical protein
VVAVSRFIGYPAAVVSGGPAWLLSKILRSTSVAKVISHPPVWLDHAELTATVAAIHQAAKAFAMTATAPERETAALTCAVTLESNPEWTVRKAADYLQLSRRRVQELASQLGGRRIGRQWILDEVAVREFARKRREVRCEIYGADRQGLL